MTSPESLDTADVRRLSASILGLRAVTADTDFPAAALGAVSGLVRADVWTWNEVDPRLDRPLVRDLPARTYDDAREARLRRFGELSHEHPLIRHTRETGDGSARRISDFIGSEELHALALYREVYVAEGVEHQVAITMPAALPRVVGIAGSRARLGDDFDEHDRTLLDLLRPHLAQSYELHRDRSRLRVLTETSLRALRGSDIHAVVLDDSPYELTPGATRLLHTAFGAPQAGDVLPRRVAEWVARQQRGEDPTDVRRPLVARRDGREVVARFVPGGTAQGDVLLLHPTPVVDLGALGLTPREAAVLALVARGRTNAQAAVELHVAASTVKTHLENAYRKLGVSNRTAAVALARDLLVSRPRSL